jgi:A/G-specific adenine glycosylase
MVTNTAVTDFQTTVWDYFQKHGRHSLPWRMPDARGQFDPYHIMVSELMLQQTQVARVLPKYQEFLQQFPSLQALAASDIGEVLKAWSGLGYNRRAKFLWQAATEIVTRFHAEFPTATADLVSLPGIGKNTAGAIQAYAFNQPVIFVETNIRTVFIHHFFTNQVDVTDAVITELVAQTVDTDNPREWYWALMDYGSYLKKSVGNNTAQSKHYAKQSMFHGSRRQIRGQVLKQLTAGSKSFESLQFRIADERLEGVLGELLSERLIKHNGADYSL